MNLFYQTTKIICPHLLKQCTSHVRAVSTTKQIFQNLSDQLDEAAKKKIKNYFDYPVKNKETFLTALDVYKASEYRSFKKQAIFVETGLSMLEEYGLHGDREIYIALLNVFPKYTFVPRNVFQGMLYHYARQQYCGTQILEKMEENRIMPDSDLENLIFGIFGRDSEPARKLHRMYYWMPKLKYLSNWRVPDELPINLLDLAAMAVKRMATVDPTMKVTVYNSNVKIEEGRLLRALPSRQFHKDTDKNIDATDVEVPTIDAPRDEWIVSAICAVQRTLIKRHKITEALKVEGPFRIYLRDKTVSYFILRAEAGEYPAEEKASDADDVSNIFNWIKHERRKKDLVHRTIHEQDDGIILAICSTETSSRSSLLSWIRLLQKDSPELSEIPILFPQTSPIGDIIKREECEETQLKKTNN